jgi:hypothetical protein
MTKKNDVSKLFKVIKNYDYTIRILDSKGRELIFRDITGKDLEFLESIFRGDSEETFESGEIRLNLDSTIKILNHLCVQKIDFCYLSRSIVFQIFSIVQKEIICNYVSKPSWLKICYVIQKNSFTNLEVMEKVPMSKFMTMYEIHKEMVKTSEPDG